MYHSITKKKKIKIGLTNLNIHKTCSLAVLVTSKYVLIKDPKSDPSYMDKHQQVCL